MTKPSYRNSLLWVVQHTPEDDPDDSEMDGLFYGYIALIAFQWGKDLIRVRRDAYRARLRYHAMLKKTAA